jgi:hypothetical protein
MLRADDYGESSTSGGGGGGGGDGHEGWGGREKCAYGGALVEGEWECRVCSKRRA